MLFLCQTSDVCFKWFLCYTVPCRNPQTESFLQFLELPYLLDSSNPGGVDINVSSSQAAPALDNDDIELPDEVEDDEDDEE
uniref:Uncharacterized protein n=1 Tax=Aegilops tauschii subsp. strangulata TaxID=200361 RepID=A0A453H9R7_AEGTS